MKPVLLLSLDGVIIRGDGPDVSTGGFVRYRTPSGPIGVSPKHGPWLRGLARSYEIVPVTDVSPRRARDLERLLGLPTATLRAGGVRLRDQDGLRGLVGGRPFAWVSTDFDSSARQWAATHRAPSLLVPCRADTGLAPADVSRLQAFIPVAQGQASVGGTAALRAVLVASGITDPDGRVRRPAYTTAGDASQDARLAD